MTWKDSLDKRPKRRNTGMRFGLWNIRILCRTDSLMLVSGDLDRYKLNLLAVLEVRWEGGGTEPAESTHSSKERETRMMN
jgi:hypothetical protein